MPLFAADIQKVYQGEYWTNRYIVNAPSLNDALVAARQYVARERSVSLSQVIFDKLRVSDRDPATDLYVVETLTGGGARTGAISLLPLFNVVRVDFNTGNGRPSRKYLRGLLEEGSTENMDITDPVYGTIQSSYATMMANDATFVDVDGQGFISGVVIRRIGMRQLRRGTRRRTQPIIP